MSEKIKSSLMLLTIFVVSMVVMLSDYKPICNAVGSALSVLVILIIGNTISNNSNVLERKAIRYILLFLVYYTITSLFNFDANHWITSFLYYTILFTPFLVSIYLFINDDIESMKRILIVFLIAWNVFLYLCLKTCLAIPDLARLMTAQRSMFVDIINGGGYCMGYGSAVLITYFFNNLINGCYQRKSIKLLIIAEIVFMFMAIMVINSFVVLVSAIIGCGAAFINRISKTGGNRVLSYFAVGVVLLIVYLNVGSILSFMMNNTENEFWKKRWTETYESVVLKENSHHMDDRELVYQISKDGFIQSPIFGNGYKTGNTFDHDANNGVGNHSTILDSLAQFGVVGSIPLFLFLLVPFWRSRQNGWDVVHIVPFYAMMYLNPIFTCYHTMLITYLIVPFFERLRMSNKQ